MLRLMIKLVFLLAALLFILLKNDSSTPTQALPAEEEANEAEISFFDGKFQDRLNRYTLQQPGEAWKFSPSPRSKNLIKLDITHKSGKYGMQVRVHRKGQQSFDDFVSFYIARFKQDMQDPEILNQRSFAGEGVAGVAITFDGRQRNGYFLKSYVFPGARFYYAIQGGCPFDRKDELEPELDKIAASFKPL